MRSIGIICLASGFLFLVSSSFPIALVENKVQFFFGIGCLGFVALPLIIVGIVLTRRAAAQSSPDDEAAASAAFLEDAANLYRRLSRGRATAGRADPRGNLMVRLRAFDLDYLTVTGWLLVLVDFGFVLGEVLLIYRLVLRDQPDLGPVGALLFLGAILLAAAFFCVRSATTRS